MIFTPRLHQMADVLRAIQAQLGAAPSAISSQDLTRFSTSTRLGNRDGWVRVMPNGIVRFGCWRQQITGWWRNGSDRGCSRKRDAPVDQLALANEERCRRRNEITNLQIFDSAPVLDRHSPVGRYLVSRSLGKLSKCPQDLRMARLPYFHEMREIGVFPVMLGAVTDPHGTMVAIHRTYISEDGQKASVPQIRKMTRTSGMVAGASIKLWEPVIMEGKLTLGVAEGVETALGCYLGSGIPTWSCVNAGGIRSFEWPLELQSLVIFGDNDASGVGQSAARDLASRAAAAGLEVRVLIPEIVDTDWLDAYAAVEVAP